MSYYYVGGDFQYHYVKWSLGLATIEGRLVPIMSK